MDELLVAVDGSSHSSKVVDSAIGLARKLAAKILLVNVINMPSEEPEGIKEFERIENAPDAYAEYLKDMSDALMEKLSKQVSSSGVDFRVLTPSGNPAKEILEIANLDKVTMIVIGMQGLHGLGLVESLGSVARRVLEKSKVPVYVVPA